MTKKVIQDVVVKINPSFTKKQEAKETVAAPKTEEIKKPTIVGISPSNKIDQNPFFADRTPSTNKETYLPPEWSEKDNGHKLKKLFKWLLFVFIAGSIFFITLKIVSVYSTAEITITPRQKIVDIRSDLSASDQETAPLQYQIAELPQMYEGTKEVAGSAQKELEQKATGVVMLYNNNAKSQFLVKETRLESPDGKIYKTVNSLTIPAKGSIEVNAFADKPGQEFNIGLTDFKLPGFKGNPKYETVFGRSKTPFTGGYVGKAATLSDEDYNKAVKELREEVSAHLKNSIEKNMPSGFIVYPGSTEISFATSSGNPMVGDIDKNFVIKESATAKAYLINKEQLGQKITEAYAKSLTPANHQGFRIANLDKLDFAFKKNPNDGGTIEFTIKGKAIFVWNIDKNGLLDELRNNSSSKFKDILSKHTEIESADLVFSPSWWRFVPKDDGRVKYEEKQPTQQNEG